MKKIIRFYTMAVISLLLADITTVQAQDGTKPVADTGMIVRMAEIEIYPQFLSSYKAILKEESAASVRLEPGVIAIFPTYLRDDSTLVRIIEIYADRKAYQSHLKTPHFVHYKTSTASMVKSLRLTELESIDPTSMPAIFTKLK